MNWLLKALSASLYLWVAIAASLPQLEKRATNGSMLSPLNANVY